MNCSPAKKKLLSALTAGVALAIASVQTGCGKDEADAAARAQLEQELQALRETNQELQRLRTENQELPRLRKDNEEVARLRQQTSELPQLQEENDRLRAQLHAAKPGRRP